MPTQFPTFILRSQMNAASAPTETADVPSEGACDGAWPRRLLDRQLERLDRLAEAGLELAVAVEAGAKHAGADHEGAARAYARVSRAVRQAVMLQSKLVKDFEARTAAAEKRRADAAAAVDEAHREREELRKVRVSRIVERVMMAGHDDEETVDRLVYEADERLDDDGFLGDVLARPVSEIVAQICKDLGLAPDWTRLAEEAWAIEEMAGGEAGAPLAEWEASRARPAPPAGEGAFRCDTG